MDKMLTSPNPPSCIPGAVLLETPRLIIRRFLLTDAEAVAATANHSEVSAMMSDRFPSPYTVEAAARNIAEANALLEQSSYPRRVGVLIKSGTEDNPGSQPRFIGSLNLRFGEDILFRTWALGYYVTPTEWGKGYATEMISAYVKWLLMTWPTLSRVEAETYSSNSASMRALEKSGFVRDGVRRCAVSKNGKVMDLVIFSVIRRDVGLME